MENQIHRDGNAKKPSIKKEVNRLIKLYEFYDEKCCNINGEKQVHVWMIPYENKKLALHVWRRRRMNVSVFHKSKHYNVQFNFIKNKQLIAYN